MFWVKRALDKLKKILEMFWSGGRPDLNRRPPEPQVGAPWRTAQLRAGNGKLEGVVGYVQDSPKTTSPESSLR
jgi:hypothetical protein